MQIVISMFSLLAWFLLASASSSARAQAIDLQAERQPLTPISVSWHFHSGDDPRWSQPAFDDSAWKIVQPTKDWVKQGYAETDELAWFRFKLKVPPGMPSLVILMPRIERSYQLFADGQLIGQVGSLPPDRPRTRIAAARVFTIPIHPGPQGQEVTLALRMWQSPMLRGIRPNVLRGRAYAGDSATVLRHFTTSKEAYLLSRGSSYTEGMLLMIVGAAALLLFFLTRQVLYLMFALYSVFAALPLPIDLAAQHFAWDFLTGLDVDILLDFLPTVCLAAFLLRAVNVQRRRVYIAAILCSFFADFGPWMLVHAHLPLIWADGIYFIFSFVVQVLLLTFLVRGWRQGLADAKLLLFPFAISQLFAAAGNLGHWLIDLNVPHANALLTQDIPLLKEPFAVNLDNVGSMIAQLGFLAVLVYRFARTSRERERLASAMRAAHDIQHRLVPVDIPSLGGLHTNVVYLAAEEVGGDFCQVLPRSDGSILIAVGDVSGKGLQAAMLGTLAVGALRSIADEEIEPAAALHRLNQVLLQTGSDTFVTCLCLVLTRTGEVTLANAGHLAPYLDGQEVEVISGLPLGVTAEADYEQTTFSLPPVARLTLLSDGVVEARSANGELFGFERTALVSQRSAAEIAEQANRHGQQDDITVITLDWQAPVREPVSEPALA